VANTIPPTPTPKGVDLLAQFRKTATPQPQAQPTQNSAPVAGQDMLAGVRSQSPQQTAPEIPKGLPYMALGFTPKGEAYYGPGLLGQIKKLFAGFFNPDLYNDGLEKDPNYSQEDMHNKAAESAQNIVNKIFGSEVYKSLEGFRFGEKTEKNIDTTGDLLSASVGVKPGDKDAEFNVNDLLTSFIETKNTIAEGTASKTKTGDSIKLPFLPEWKFDVSVPSLTIQKGVALGVNSLLLGMGVGAKMFKRVLSFSEGINEAGNDPNNTYAISEKPNELPDGFDRVFGQSGINKFISSKFKDKDFTLTARDKEALTNNLLASEMVYTGLFNQTLRQEAMKEIEAGVNPDAIIEKYANPWVEMGGELFFDPLNYVGPVAKALGLIDELPKATRFANAADEILKPVTPVLDDAMRGIGKASNDQQAVKSFAKLFTEDGKVLKAAADRLSGFADERGLFSLVSEGKKWWINRRTGGVLRMISKEAGENPDEMMEIVTALINRGDDSLEIANAARTTLAHSKFGKMMFSEAGYETSVLLRKILGGDTSEEFLELLAKNSGNIEDLTKFVLKRTGKVVDDMVPSVNEMRDAYLKVEHGIDTSEKLINLHDKYKDLAGTVKVFNEINNGLRKGLFGFGYDRFNRFFSGVYMGLNPGYAMRNVFQDTLHLAADGNLKVAGKGFLMNMGSIWGENGLFSPGKTFRRTFDSLAEYGADMQLAAAGKGVHAAEEATAKVGWFKPGSPLAKLFNKVDTRVMGEAFEGGSSLALYQHAFVQEMERAWRSGAMPATDNLVKAGLPKETADLLYRYIIDNKGNVKKGLDAFRTDLGAGIIESWRYSPIPDRMASFLKSPTISLYDEYMNIRKTAVSKMDFENKVNTMVRDLMAKASEASTEVIAGHVNDDQVTRGMWEMFEGAMKASKGQFSRAERDYFGALVNLQGRLRESQMDMFASVREFVAKDAHVTASRINDFQITVDKIGRSFSQTVKAQANHFTSAIGDIANLAKANPKMDIEELKDMVPILADGMPFRSQAVTKSEFLRDVWKFQRDSTSAFYTKSNLGYLEETRQVGHKLLMEVPGMTEKIATDFMKGGEAGQKFSQTYNDLMALAGEKNLDSFLRPNMTNIPEGTKVNLDGLLSALDEKGYTGGLNHFLAGVNKMNKESAELVDGAVATVYKSANEITHADALAYMKKEGLHVPELSADFVPTKMLNETRYADELDVYNYFNNMVDDNLKIKSITELPANMKSAVIDELKRLKAEWSQFYNPAGRYVELDDLGNEIYKRSPASYPDWFKNTFLNYKTEEKTVNVGKGYFKGTAVRKTTKTVYPNYRRMFGALDDLISGSDKGGVFFEKWKGLALGRVSNETLDVVKNAATKGVKSAYDEWFQYASREARHDIDNVERFVQYILEPAQERAKVMAAGFNRTKLMDDVNDIERALTGIGNATGDRASAFLDILEERIGRLSQVAFAKPDADEVMVNRIMDVIDKIANRKSYVPIERRIVDLTPEMLAGSRRVPTSPNVMHTTAGAILENLDGFIKDLTEDMNTYKNNWGKTSGGFTNPAIEKELVSWGKVADARMVEARAFANKIAINTRDFALHAYSDKTYADLALSYIYPYSYWYTRSYKKWAVRLAQNPEIIAGYAKYRRALEQAHAGMPEYFKYNLSQNDLPGVDKDNPYYLNLEATLNPLNGMTGLDFNDTNKRVTWYARAVDDLSKFGPSTFTPFSWVVGAALYKQGENEAASRWFGRLFPQTSMIKSNLFEYNKLTGTEPIVRYNEFDPFVQIFSDGLDAYERRKVGRALGGMVDSGQITPEMGMDVAQSKTGEYWMQAVQNAQTERFGSNLASFFLGTGFKARSNNDIQIDNFYTEYFQLMQNRPNMSPQEFADGMAAVGSKYPWMDTILLSRKDGETRDPSYAYTVLGRMAPGQQTDLLEAAGINTDMLNRFYEGKGTFEGFTPSDKGRFMDGIVDIGALLKMPDYATKMEWNAAKAARVARDEQLAKEFGSNYQSMLDDYYLSDNRSDYIDSHPNIRVMLDRKTTLTMNNPLLYKYYGGMDTIESYYTSLKYQKLAERYPEASAKWKIYSDMKSVDTKAAARYLKANPDMSAYTDYKQQMEAEIDRAIMRVYGMMPDVPENELRPDFSAIGKNRQDLLKAATPPQPFTWPEAVQAFGLSENVQFLVKDYWLNNGALSSAALSNLDQIARNFGLYYGRKLDGHELLRLLGQSLGQ